MIKSASTIRTGPASAGPARRFKTAALSLVAALVLTSCAGNPTGGTDFVLMSESAEIEKGRELHQQMMSQTPTYSEEDLTAYVNRIGQKMASISHRPELEYEFTIIDSPDINAFALPGGFVYINRGLLTYLTTEAQLAAVLGHEIGHITARHAVRQQSASRASNVLSTALVLATGAPSLGETTSLVSGALLSGYGRDMELEADQLGAEYLAKAGYDPMAMVEVISVLKNQEDFNKKVSGKGPSYHGLFATHPRNDTRLREVVGKAGELSAEVESEIDPAEFRQQLTGMPIGQTLQSANTQDRNRYYQNLLNYTLIFPPAWDTEETPTTVTAANPDGTASLEVAVQRLHEVKEPRLFIREDLGIDALQSTERLSQYGLPGYTGINPDTGERIAVIYYGPRAYIFTGATDADAPANTDKQILSSIRTFRPIARSEKAIADPVSIEYVRVNDDGTTYAQLARQSRLAQHAEDRLRLMNGDYPSGEPEAGEWVKIAR